MLCNSLFNSPIVYSHLNSALKRFSQIFVIYIHICSQCSIDLSPIAFAFDRNQCLPYSLNFPECYLFYSFLLNVLHYSKVPNSVSEI